MLPSTPLFTPLSKSLMTFRNSFRCSRQFLSLFMTLAFFGQNRTKIVTFPDYFQETQVCKIITIIKL
jgi:hypothetical protein